MQRYVIIHQMHRKDVDSMAKKNSKRGFTLVELIVVLVILAILAALLIPALTGYINKARKSQVVAETRALTQAVQTEMSTLYGSNEYAEQVSKNKNTFTVAAKDGFAAEITNTDKQTLTDLDKRYTAIVNLSEVPSLTKGTGSFFAVSDLSGKLRWVVYDDGKGYYGVYCQADGAVTGYTKDELKTYDSYEKYKGKILCCEFSDDPKSPGQMWTPTFVYPTLGLGQYNKDNEWG